MISLLITTGLLVSENLFARALGDTSDEVAWSMTPTADGGYAVAGMTQSFGAGDYDILVVKLDSSGDLSWARTFGGPAYDDAVCVIQTPDRGFVVGGTTYNSAAGDPDFSNPDLLVLRLDDGGNLSWARSFGGPGDDYFFSLALAPAGGFVVTGQTFSFGAGSSDMLLMELDSSGNLSWARTFGGAGVDLAYSVICTADGGCALAGITESFGAGDRDFFLVKTDKSGNLSWARTFGGEGDDAAWSMTQAPDGGYVLAGRTESFGAGSYDFLVLKLDKAGTLSWARTFGGEGDETANLVARAPDGGYAVAGYTQSFGAGSSDMFMLKMDKSGTLSWARTFGWWDHEGASSVAVTPGRGYVLAGATKSYGAGMSDFLVVKLDKDGNYQDCVEACSPETGKPTLQKSSPKPTVTTPGISDSSPKLSVTSPELTITDACEPVVR